MRSRGGRRRVQSGRARAGIGLSLSIDFAEPVGKLVCAGPTDTDEDVKDVHERGVAIGALTKNRAVLRQVSRDNIDYESLAEGFVLIAVFAAGAYDVAREDKSPGRVSGDEVLEGVEDLMCGVWVTDTCQLRQYRLGVRVEDIGGQEQGLPASWISFAAPSRGVRSCRQFHDRRQYHHPLFSKRESPCVSLSVGDPRLAINTSILEVICDSWTN